MNLIQQNNTEHYASLKMVEDFKKSGGKVVTALPGKASIITSKIKTRKQREVEPRSFLAATKLFKKHLKAAKSLSSDDVITLTGYERSTIFRVAKELEQDGFIVRTKGKKANNFTAFEWVGN